VLEISVLMAQFPSREIAQLSLRVPHARPWLCEWSGGLLMFVRAFRMDVGTPASARCAGALSALMTGVAYRDPAEIGASASGVLSGLQKESRGDAAGDP